MSLPQSTSKFCTVLGFGSLLFATLAQARELSFDERVAAQKAIEQVYWNHRIWPKENPGPKPPLSTVMSDDVIRAKVLDYLKQSNALATWWQRPVGPETLQAEIDRMARHSRDPRTLRELYDVLGNDPFLIAETLGRQTLVNRLARSWYSSDPRFHDATKAKAEAALAACASVDCMKSMPGEFHSTTWKLRVAGSDPRTELKSEGVLFIDTDELKSRREHWAQSLGGDPESLPLARLSGLEETAEAFTVTAVRSQRDGEITTWSVTWRKRSFDSWWAAERLGTSPETAAQDALYALAAPSTDPCTIDTWAETIDEPAARALHSAVWTGAEMIVWGGYSDAQVNSGGCYNPSTDTWTPTSQGANVPSARFSHVAFWTGTKMIVWGGNFGGATGGRYDPGTDTWLPTSTGANTPTARLNFAAVWTGTEMIIWGGGSYLNTGALYNPANDTWTATSTGTNVPSPRNDPKAVWTGSEMIVFGGGNNGGFLSDGGRYNPSTDSWATMTPAVPSLPFIPFGPSVWTGSEMIIWGSHAQGGRYNLSTDTWTQTSQDGGTPSDRSGHTMVWTGTRMIVWGGSAGGGTTNTGGSYDPSTNSWATIPVVANTPSARYLHTTVWTGTEMIVWGGTPCSGCSLFQGSFLNSGGRYNPSTNSWIATHRKTDVPTSRGGTTAVWTGTEMLLWGGGIVGGGATNTGARYNPATDSWTPTSVVPNTPSARGGHTAVWTGTEMIVWGGGGGGLNTGGLYNPSTDDWTPTLVDLSVQTRTSYSVVWTGTEMIIWGGNNGPYLNQGARYSPATNTWMLTSVGTNTPFGRAWHTAVWTGTEMIVWGGYDGSALNSGGRYDPSINSWSATSTGTNVPLGHWRHSAVWSGTQMVVWGGQSITGGRYDPSTDSWTPTSTAANVPTARLYSTVVWTGAEMIIWGGAASDLLNTGARYNPVTDVWTPTSLGANLPIPRSNHTAIWTGTQMIVWGGSTVDVSPGIYCACPSSLIVYHDADGDGYGSPSVSMRGCDGTVPAGFAANSTDCNDANPNLHPGATEICNALDDDCDGTADNSAPALCNDGDACTDDVCNGVAGCSHPLNSAPCDDGVQCTNNDACNAGTCAGVVGPPPEIRGVSAVGHDVTTLGWTGFGGGTTYDLMTSTLADLRIQATSGASCLADNVPGASYIDPQPNPVPGGGYYYLMRAQNVCGDGGYGFDSNDVERTPLAPCP